MPAYSEFREAARAHTSPNTFTVFNARRPPGIGSGAAPDIHGARGPSKLVAIGNHSGVALSPGQAAVCRLIQSLSVCGVRVRLAPPTRFA